MRIGKLAAALMLGLSAAGLSGCATGFPAQVSRYQAMPAPQGQSFFVVPMDARMNGGLEYSRYATMIAQAMQAQGYAAATSPQSATMLVRISYGVDRGRREYVRDIGGWDRWNDPFGRGYGYIGHPYYSRWGYYGPRSPFYYGWNDPFYGSGFDDGVRAYTVYQSFFDMDIRRRADNQALFEGHAKARSHNDNLGTLVPNLVEAMFTGFPGRSGETVKITVPTPRRPS